MKTEDGAIIYKCLNGDREAFAFLVDKYKAAIYAYVLAKIGNRHDAEDVTQEVFIKAYKDLPRLRRWDSFAHWLYAIASCRCRNWKRSKSRRPDNEFIEDQEPAKLEKLMSEPAIESYKNNELDETLHEALNSLPEIYREVLMLYYMGGMNSEQIANALMKTPDSIRQRLSLVAMMSTALPKQRLQASFTFRIVETIKKIKINPFSDIKGLPWGLSLATGIIIAVMSFSSNLPQIIEFGDASGFPLPIESQVSKVGEIPVSLMKISDTTIISNSMKKADNGESKKPDIQNALFMAPQGEGKWTRKADMPFGATFSPGFELGGKMYIFTEWGGVWEYDPENEKWTEKAIGKLFRDSSTLVFGDKVYVLTEPGNFYEYDPIADKWTEKAKSQFLRRASALAILNGKIYAIGGADLNNIIHSFVEEYDPINNTWTRKNDLPFPRAWGSVCTIDDKIYYFGGAINDAAVSTTLLYNPENDEWIKKADMIQGACFIPRTAPVIDGKAYVIGGSHNWTPQSKMQVYDPKKDEWTNVPDMPTARYSVIATTYKDKIYVFGGSTTVDIVIRNSMSILEVYDVNGGNPPKAVSARDKLPSGWGKIKK
jgi:RNA polymerase sigma factor (sigma-70 family)